MMLLAAKVHPRSVEGELVAAQPEPLEGGAGALVPVVHRVGVEPLDRPQPFFLAAPDLGVLVDLRQLDADLVVAARL